MNCNIQILISLLSQHGVDRAVVCPGSRNAPIVHWLNECGAMECRSVTDERSAGFVALGMALATGKPVAVCVTSGTALLNLAPAVAEAYYRQVSLVVVSADRPQMWIDQLDGQTLRQPGALGCLVACSITLPESTDGENRRYCERLVNEAMLASRCPVGRPVHINVPLSEPLFDFTISDTPRVKAVAHIGNSGISFEQARLIGDRLKRAARPMIVVGQCGFSCDISDCLRKLSECFVVLQEPLSPGRGAVGFDEVIGRVGMSVDYMPDFIL
ncbi:MAG: 2-succinyl-5-enolpyruvyl-6-hydroxy-3-cyclohexene-1-carboxylic-acid synthase, partial [Prevotella sp.]|nr:2-succinyl-5-enolpyruvyl-6-hydroxy-3-cyclohexene-1-carboxylic-acid synthase [Prevotella sp.]